MTTNEEGKYQLTSLEPGTYNIWVNAPEDRVCVAIDSFVVEGGKTYTAPDMKFVEGGWLEGHVVDAESGKPLTKVDADGGKPLTEYDEIGAKLMIGCERTIVPKSFGLSCPPTLTTRDTFGSASPPAFSSRLSWQYAVWNRTQRRELL